MRHAMIMAGGTGTRLWPVSRNDRPKQLVPLIERDGRRLSLLELAAGRLEGVVPPERRIICTNESYRGAIKSVLPDFGDEQILGEPVGRDTINAVGFGAAVLHKQDPDAIFAVVTADQLIEPEELFRERMDLAFSLVEKDASRLVTFSIRPTYAATGYGYVERGTPLAGTNKLAFNVERFVEKPDLARAQAYLESGAFGWNSGMFVWKAKTILECLERFVPETYAGAMRIAQAWGTAEQESVLNEVYPTLPRTSVDYGVMEPAAREQSEGTGRVRICTVSMEVRWLDVGSWPSLAETLAPDERGNAVAGTGRVRGSSNCLVFNESPSHHVAVLGCDGLVVVHTADATLVMPKSRAEELKHLHAELPDELK